MDDAFRQTIDTYMARAGIELGDYETLSEATDAINLETQGYLGTGIPEADLPYIFERFKQGKDTEARQGSGLGLAIVKSLVELQGGESRRRTRRKPGLSSGATALDKMTITIVYN